MFEKRFLCGADHQPKAFDAVRITHVYSELYIAKNYDPW